jgi:hypothetical protein
MTSLHFRQVVVSGVLRGVRRIGSVGGITGITHGRRSLGRRVDEPGCFRVLIALEALQPFDQPGRIVRRGGDLAQRNDRRLVAVRRHARRLSAVERAGPRRRDMDQREAVRYDLFAVDGCDACHVDSPEVW